MIVSLRPGVMSEQEWQGKVLECIERKMKNLAVRSPRYSRFVPRQALFSQWMSGDSSDNVSATGPLSAVRSVSAVRSRPRCQTRLSLDQCKLPDQVTALNQLQTHSQIRQSLEIELGATVPATLSASYLLYPPRLHSAQTTEMWETKESWTWRDASGKSSVTSFTFSLFVLLDIRAPAVPSVAVPPISTLVVICQNTGCTISRRTTGVCTQNLQRALLRARAHVTYLIRLPH